MTTTKYRQFRLFDDRGNAYVTCWLEDDARLQTGARLTLRETGAIVWRILNRYDTTMPMKPETRWPETRWKVGGLK